MISSQFTLPRSQIANFLDVVANSTCSIRAMQPVPIGNADASWMRYQCIASQSQAMITIGEHRELPSDSVITIAIDIRRLWRITRFFGDSALVKAICRNTIDLGGKRMDD